MTYKKEYDKYRVNKTVSIAKTSQAIFSKAFGKRGINDIRVISNWSMIVGKELAGVSIPTKITYKKGTKNNGTMHISVIGAYATEISYKSGLIVEKVNSFFGFGAVSDIKLSHNFVPPEKETEEVIEKPLDIDSKKLEDMIGSVEDEDLKSALKKLGEHVVVKK
ncbi:MAG: DUF721 domain-containing protein [Alphaproteobacteria bacterium]